MFLRLFCDRLVWLYALVCVVIQGWQTSAAVDMNHFYNHYVCDSEKQRVNALEPFDEFEEWSLKCSHYSLITAFSGGAISASKLGAIWPTINAEKCKIEATAAQLSQQCVVNFCGGYYGFATASVDHDSSLTTHSNLSHKIQQTIPTAAHRTHINEASAAHIKAKSVINLN